MKEDLISKFDRINYDGPWKSLIEVISEDFFLFFLPEIHPLIDFSKEVIFLKQDLPKIVADGQRKGFVVKDNIIQVHLKNGQKRWLLIHIETEAGHDENFSERMFVYFYRSKDKYPHELTALAIFLGQQIPSNHDKFTYQFGKTKVTYEYPTYSVRDSSIEELKKSDNPFALAVLACRYVLESRKEKTKAKKFEKRLSLKLELVDFLKKHCDQRNYSDQKLQMLVSFVLNILLLPAPYELDFQTTILQAYKNDNTMKPTEVDKQFADIILKVQYGETGQSLYEKAQKAKELEKELEKAVLQHQLYIQKMEKKAKQEKLKAEEEKKALALKAKQEKLKAEEEKKALALKAKQEKLKAEEEKKALALKAKKEKKALALKVEEEKKNTAQKLQKEMNFSFEQIATFMNVSVETVKQLLA